MYLQCSDLKSVVIINFWFEVGECDPAQIQNLKGHLMMAFFLGRMIICQKDIVENPLKTPVLKKKQNSVLKKKENLKKKSKKKQNKHQI